MGLEDTSLAELIELQDLLEFLNEDELTEEQNARLQEIVVRNTKARQYYLQTMFFFAQLRWQAAHLDDDAKPLTSPAPASTLGFITDSYRWCCDYFSHEIPFALLCIIVAGSLYMGLCWLLISFDQRFGVSSARPDFVAQITATKDCLWSAAALPPSTNSQLQVGMQLQLEKGFAQITYFNKAVVLLEGPVSYTVDSPKSGFLSRGKLTVKADTQQSRQFAIITPNARFVDFGTEFGVMIDDKGRSAVAVFKGKVKAEAKLADGRWSIPLSLQKGEAVVCERTKFIPQVSKRSDFPSPLPPPPLPLYQNWLNASRELQSRRDLLAYYDFQPDPNNSKVLFNRSSTGAILNGEVQGARWVDGRFPGKSALEFKTARCGVKIDLPQELTSLTLAAWVNIESLPSPPHYHNSLIMSDGWRIPFAVHWYVKQDGLLCFAIQNQAADLFTGLGDVPNAEPGGWLYPKDQLNRWCMVVTTYNASAKQILHYFNGKLVETKSLEQSIPVKFGPSMIGTWNPMGIQGDTESTLDGRMDELMFFESVLSPEEIQKMYEDGKPEAGDN